MNATVIDEYSIIIYSASKPHVRVIWLPYLGTREQNRIHYISGSGRINAVIHAPGNPYLKAV